MAGAEREFEELVAAQAAPLLRAAYLLTGDRGRAEDLVQSTLTKAYVARARVVGADSPEAYLRRILVTTHHRSFRRRRVREELRADVPETAARADDVAARRDLVAAVAALPARQRAVVVLRYLEDRPEAEVAAILGCSAGTVKSQASRALAALRGHPALTDTPLATKEAGR
ncbi:MAG TPA: SigE family RNA polymerase sigma factor [Frankiaceae bacterium]|nr:SigE family RNA polymerase sigma factor [Frankiaceae bacterium]